MGFGGANGHITLEEANPDAAPAEEQLKLLGSNQASELIALSAPDLATLQAEVSRLVPIARKICLAELTDLSAALAKRTPQGPCRLAFVVGTPWQFADKLELALQELRQGAELSAIHDPASGIFAGTAVESPQWVALFPGQGSHRLNMGEPYHARFPFLQHLYSQCDSPAQQPLSTQIFRDVLAGDAPTREGWELELRATHVAQPAIVLSSMATLAVLRFFGLEPHVAIVHSLGEISALAAGGAWDAGTAVRLAALRGRAMASLNTPDPGGMVALAAQPDED
jgi:acyl transferase domain-containing protein